MWSLVVAMLVILAIAGVVMLYVAYPHRGEQVPRAPWVGRALGRAVGRAPVMKDGDLDEFETTRR